jgi:hypothetical protein
MSYERASASVDRGEESRPMQRGLVDRIGLPLP